MPVIPYGQWSLKITHPKKRLTPRQRQVIELTEQGKGSTEIARIIGVSKQRIQQITKGLGINTPPKARKTARSMMIGSKHGKFTVMGYNGSYFLLRCECGNEVGRYENRLAKRCPKCEPLPIPEGKDLTGKRFGNRVVIGRTKSLQLWKCRCDCGNISNVLRQNLIAGKSNMCRDCRDGIGHYTRRR